MKTRVIALVLAVCMMLGLCAFASASVDGTNSCCSNPSPYYRYENRGSEVWVVVECQNCGAFLYDSRVK